MPKTLSVTVRDLLVLQIINDLGPICAYHILSTPRLIGTYFAQPPNPSSLYMCLHKLHKLGYTTARTAHSKHAPARREYSLSVVGKQVLQIEAGRKLSESYRDLFHIQNKYRAATVFLQDLQKLLAPQPIDTTL